MGVVKYIDYQTEGFSASDLFSACMHKRKSFAHERELRAVVSRGEWPMTNDNTVDLDHVPSEPGVWVGVPLVELITEVRVAPQADGWFEHLVRKVVGRYGLEKDVARSSLESTPFF